MSVHLLRQGVRTRKLTIPRLTTSVRRSYSAQATRVLADSSSLSDHVSEPVPIPHSKEPAVLVNNAPSSSIVDEPKKTNARSKSLKSKKKTGEAGSTERVRNPLQPTRVDMYLASLSAAGLEPTLEDVERYRPEKHPPTSSPHFAEAYNGLVDSLCRSFTKEQLRNFVSQYGLDPALSMKKRRKAEYAEAIIENQWKWPSLEEVESAKRERTEIAHECTSLLVPI